MYTLYDKNKFIFDFAKKLKGQSLEKAYLIRGSIVDNTLSLNEVLSLDAYTEDSTMDSIIINKKFIQASINAFIQNNWVYILVHTHNINPGMVTSFSNKDIEFEKNFYQLAVKLGYKYPLVSIVLDINSYVARAVYKENVYKDIIINMDSSFIKCDESNLHIVTTDDKGLIYYTPTNSMVKLSMQAACQLKEIQNNLKSNKQIRFQEMAVQELLYPYFNKNLIGKNEAKSFINSNKISKLEIIVQNACNLDCKYCYANGGTYNHKSSYLTPENAKKYIEALINTDIKQVEEVAFFGGEPTQYPDTIKSVCEVFQNLVSKKILERMPDFTMVTNCTLYNQNLIDTINKYNIQITISIDGPQIIHDKLRVDKNGQGSFSRVINTLEVFKQNNIIPNMIEATYTSLHEELCLSRKDIEQFFRSELGISNIYIVDCESDIYGPHTHSYTDYIKDYIAELQNKDIQSLNKNIMAFFYTRLLRIYNKTKLECDIPCPAGYSHVSLVSDGKLYPCHKFIFNKKYCMGEYDSELNKYNYTNLSDTESKLNKYKKNEFKKCKNCWARFLCDPCTWDLISNPQNDRKCEERKNVLDILFTKIICNENFENMTRSIYEYFE